MIQRIQSVFLTIAAIWAIVLVMTDPVMLSLTSSRAVFQLKNLGLFTITGNVNQMTTYPLICVLALCVILPVFAILKYGDRKLQMKVVRFGMILQLAYLVILVFYVDRASMVIGEEVDIALSVWVYTIIVPIICSFLANRFIKKDENMVRAADRLR
jgi:glucan phosphoethanolaminetransferase (alkaline phosphatase superfamily)